MQRLADARRWTAEAGGLFSGTASWRPSGTAGPTRSRIPRQPRASRPAPTPAFVAGDELADLAETDPRIVVLTADLANANRTIDFAQRHPNRFFNMGIAEQNMISVAAGLASTGLIPYVATFAAYVALLGCEQIRTDCAYTGMPVRILGHHSGMSLGFYGTSHHSLEDLAIMRSIADLTVVCAADANQLRAILRASLNCKGAMYIRLGRGRDPEVYGKEPPQNFLLGKAVRLREGADLTIITTGSQVHASLAAADALAAAGISTRVVDMHTIKPLDEDEALAAAPRDRRRADRRGAQHHRGTGFGRRRGAGRRGRGLQVPTARSAGRARAARPARRPVRALPAGRGRDRSRRPRAAGPLSRRRHKMTEVISQARVRTADAALRARARAVIPGGMYGHLSANALSPEYPQFYDRAQGAHVWDVDGNEYVDFMCSFGPILLGHNHPAVEAAAAAQRAKGDTMSGPGAAMVEAAELLDGPRRTRRLGHVRQERHRRHDDRADGRAGRDRPVEGARRQGRLPRRLAHVHPPRRRRHRRGPGQPALLHVQRPDQRGEGDSRCRARGRGRHHRLALPARRRLRPGADRRRVRARAARALRPDRRGADHG